MTAHEKIEPGTALALPPDLSEMVKGRDEAITQWLNVYDTLHAGMDAAGRASIGGALALNVGSSARYGDDDAHKRVELLLSSKPASKWNDATGQREEMPARTAFEENITQGIDRACWQSLMTKLGFDALLDAQAREEWRESLTKAPPPFSEESARATFGHLWGNRREIYLRGIANVFMKMDRRFRSHDAFEIGNRLIIENAFMDWGTWNNYERRDTLHDVERIFRELDGLAPLDYDKGITAELSQIARSRPGECENDYFKARVFKNGNVHLWFTNKKLLAEVNALLLEYYKPVEGETSEEGPDYESGPLFHSTPAKKFGQFFSSEAVGQAVISRVDRSLKGARVLEPSAGGGMLAKLARDAGAHVECVEVQDGLAHELAKAGFSTRCGDFLKMTPAQLGTFDVILMNPPFDRGRDCDHVRHAFTFLKPGGVLVAVMSARAEFAEDARHKALHDLIRRTDDRWNWLWRDLPEGSFAHAGTNVNTVTLRLAKGRA